MYLVLLLQKFHGKKFFVMIVGFTKVIKIMLFDHGNLKLYGKFINAILLLRLHYNTTKHCQIFVKVATLIN